ncbi:glycosyltransferase family protein [Pedobacter nutrimenti]|uniref:Glycosyltransferase involved in cell wall biosynthesis n=1 Tax=Pedobacter nutrimenti TaxID=1241337 RepID=A0A318UH35_9SPHI|nr:hypothetical protein [Pedobacter nutrimenti]PYF75453.1 hypothetical protein B0O44_1022 [Pedobacter nutrimenti]
MDKKKLKVYIASNVGIDYFFFLAKTLKEADYEVEPVFLITEVNYRKWTKASGLKKIWLRLQMYVFYPGLLLFKACICDKKSIFVITSNTFFAPVLMSYILHLRKVKVIHLLYDLFPDALEIAGAFRRSSFLSKGIGNIMRRSQAKCDATVYLGDFLKFHAEKRWGRSKSSETIDISTDLALYTESFVHNPPSSKLIIHYGGQLGHLHDAISIVESIKYIYTSDIADLVEFNFYVSGAQAQFVKNALKGYPIKVISAVPSYEWRKDIRNFHIGLVSLSPGGASVCLPSKTYGMMAGGMAILAICPEWSDLAVLVKSINAGYVVNNSIYSSSLELNDGDYLDNVAKKRSITEIVECFYTTVKTILNQKDLLLEKRTNAYKGVRAKHDVIQLSEKWDKLIRDVSGK